MARELYFSARITRSSASTSLGNCLSSPWVGVRSTSDDFGDSIIMRYFSMLLPTFSVLRQASPCRSTNKRVPASSPSSLPRSMNASWCCPMMLCG